MSLESELAKRFKENGWTWNFNQGPVVPTEEDIQAVLDEAAVRLYNEPVGAQLEIGRLVIKKKTIGHDVYVYVGPYE